MNGLHKYQKHNPNSLMIVHQYHESDSIPVYNDTDSEQESRTESQKAMHPQLHMAHHEYQWPSSN